MDPFCGGFTTARQALRRGRRFVGFELNANAYDAFVPALTDIEAIPDPEIQTVDPVELARRQKMRESWRRDRARRKQQEDA
jgi:hypothetical protein